ncbi:hypothetical protein J3A83DRAFT_4312350 [Scleroderma citrinum]
MTTVTSITYQLHAAMPLLARVTGSQLLLFFFFCMYPFTANCRVWPVTVPWASVHLRAPWPMSLGSGLCTSANSTDNRG